MARMVRAVEGGGLRRDFAEFRRIVGDAAREARACLDPALPRRPRVGVVGEIYLRSHPGSNEDLLRELERHGAEVVKSSLAEWFTFITYCRVGERRRGPESTCAAGASGSDPSVRVIVDNLLGGITKCDEVAKGIIVLIYPRK